MRVLRPGPSRLWAKVALSKSRVITIGLVGKRLVHFILTVTVMQAEQNVEDILKEIER